MVWVTDHEGGRNDAFRAIGQYVVTFSELVREMREMACQHVAKGVGEMHVSALLLGEATPQVIANSFFGLCRTRGDLDTEEEKVWSALRREVKEAIETRNDIAHGDWEVGAMAFTEGETPRVLKPRLVRIIPARTEGPFKLIELSVEDIDALSRRLEALLALAEEFGKLALKLPVFVRGGKNHVSTGEYRVRDVLTAKKSKDAPMRIGRDGPHAHLVVGGVYTSLAIRGQSFRSPESSNIRRSESE